MLQDVEDARVVFRRRAKADGERLVVVVVGEVQQAGARSCVAADVRGSLDFRQVLARFDGEAVQGRSVGKFHVKPAF